MQDWMLRPHLLHVDGVTEVNTVVVYSRQFHITPDPAKLVAYGLSLRYLVDAVGRNNENVGAGYIERSGQQYLIPVPGPVADAGGIEQIVVATRDGPPLRIGGFAEGDEGQELRTGAATRDGEADVTGNIFILNGDTSG